MLGDMVAAGKRAVSRRKLVVLCIALLTVTSLMTSSSRLSQVQPRSVKKSTIPGSQRVVATTHGSAADRSFAEDEATKSPFYPDEPPAIPVQNKSGLISLSTSTGKYFLLYHKGNRTFNPNIIPHPTEPEKWITVARARWVQERNDIELACVASFIDDALVCDGPAYELPVDVLLEGNCDEELWYMNGMPGNQGPRDARVFWGPDEPYVMYNALASKNCLGLWMQNARWLLEPFQTEHRDDTTAFATRTELQRPDSYGQEEKNYFVFWDAEKKPYVHHDIFPQRVFAALNADGSVGEDLAPHAAESDKMCMDKYMPELAKDMDHVHQGTNSLSITLCNRGECEPDETNTFVMHVFQRKTIHNAYSQYEPYTILFRQDAPFTIHGISAEPLWVHGRTQQRDPTTHDLDLDDLISGQDDFLYVTSMSWKSSEQKYHGFLDDVVFLTFGVHDGQSGATDFKARHLLGSMAYC